MNHPFPRALSGAALFLSLASGACSDAQVQNAPSASAQAMPSSLFSRVLIVSGGPDTDNNQYAIESNARYVASLTRNAKWRRVLFADGNPASRTITSVVDTPRARARTIAAWMWEIDAPSETTEINAPTLSPITGAATPDSIKKNLSALGQLNSTEVGARELVYFTGHGSPGRNFLGNDFDNTLYAAWNGDFSTRSLARELQRSKSKAPLVLVMVQCHSGGFANTLFQGGDSAKPLWNRDFCGFFASTAERPAAGCTNEVNERDYQDFTTHFFAALSGRTRDGRAVSGADYDKNGSVSLNEAFAYANINDDSIDVPLNTSDAFLCHVFPGQSSSWQKTPFSSVQRSAASWQRALLDNLSARLRLSGDGRLQLAQQRLSALVSAEKSAQSGEFQLPPGVNARQFNAAYNRLESKLKARFPRFATRRTSKSNAADLNAATTFLASQTRDLNTVYDAYNKSASTSQNEIEEARLLRFLRCARSITLEARLQRSGTPAQKAAFARLRAGEARSEF